jgi:hypothetical protein
MRTEYLAAWLLTLGLHVGILLSLAWIADRTVLRGHLGWREWLWRIALLGGVLTATGQFLIDAPKVAHIAVINAAGPVPQRAERAESASAVAANPTARRSFAGAPEVTASTPVRASPEPAPATRSLPLAPAFSLQLPGWHVLVVVGWLAGCLIVFGRLGAAWLGLHRALANVCPLVHPTLDRDAAELAALAGIARPGLGVLEGLDSPLAVGGGRIVLPPWVVEQFDRDQLRAMLAHEIAHLARRDPNSKLLHALICALLWFMPLAAIARRRLDEIAEQSCDAWAAGQMGDGRPLAECLAGCAARSVRRSESEELASAMAGRHSPLLKRINQLMDGYSMNTTLSVPRAIAASALALLAAMVLLPGIGVSAATAGSALAAPPPPPAPPAPPAPAAPPAPPAPPPETADSPGQHLHVSSETDLFGRNHQTISMQSADGRRIYRARIDGQVTFTPDYKGIASLDSDGTASFGETREGINRRIEYASKGGKLERRYFVGEKELPIDAAADAWIAGIIPELVRETAIDADKRVRQIHASGGAMAVLDEIARIHSDYARGQYIQQLAAIGKLSPAEMTRALSLVEPFESDYERRTALTALGTAGKFDAGQQALVIGQAEKIGSDYERAELLLAILPDLAGDRSVHEAWIQAANGIGSDYEHRRCLTAMIEAGGNDDATLALVIDAAKTIESGYERRVLLASLAETIGNADQVAAAYAFAVAGIDGDYERREALMALINARGFGARASAAVLDSLASVGSDYERREVLVALAGKMPDDAQLISRYRDAARKLSDYERSQAEQALDRFASR